ncbi:pentatricopeptide repeat-containing protein At4g14820-like [Selaginella moellendorffii]|uniref:pentatricopeptide repeat-containing protein At4g14820-like n=1 Tax=Selaginella moellendorffii TaxID=88036 RepID=UPI000D1C4ABF|nr:pentatricopeptide repeat-containing protein At4g14820-like [Selaginella moellendorffii]|eukprot:XP_024536942.1 pentatricopeptide repeat-containing protein At4g14820-like [Selaginella moellendorffii]
MERPSSIVMFRPHRSGILCEVLSGSGAAPARSSRSQQGPFSISRSCIASSSSPKPRFIQNLVVEIYGKCGSTQDASLVFESMRERNVVSWNAMVSAMAKNKQHAQAIEVFRRMLLGHAVWICRERTRERSSPLLREMDLEGIKPDSVTFIGAVDACASLPCLTRGRNIHQRIERIYGSQLDTNLGNALVNMYGKCGNLVLARETFQSVKKDLVPWNAMIAHNGHGSETVELLLELSLEGIEPDHVTSLRVIFGCGNAGLLEDGLEYLTRMCDDYGLIPQMNHYGCMVDLLGKAGWLSLLD